MTLTDLFNPTFFMFLGILLLVVALLVVYFENKMREQNHKIASMLSLVSTLAEDMNGVKFGLNHLARNNQAIPMDPLNTAFISGDDNKLITVSDDENESDLESDLESDDGEESDNEVDSFNEEENSVAEASFNEVSDNEVESFNEGSVASFNEVSDNEDEDSQSEVKVLKLNISKEADESDLEFEENEELEDLDDSLSDTSEFAPEEPLEDLNEVPISASDLKTININLEEPQVDYKKLPLPKLRTIVAEKGLSADASKLKKNELLKLLESE